MFKRITTIQEHQLKENKKHLSDDKVNHKLTIKKNNYIKNDLELNINRKKSIENKLSSGLNLNFCYFIFHYITCNRHKIIEYESAITNTEKLLSISTFSKLMTFQFEETKEHG